MVEHPGARRPQLKRTKRGLLQNKIKQIRVTEMQDSISIVQWISYRHITAQLLRKLWANRKGLRARNRSKSSICRVREVLCCLGRYFLDVWKRLRGLKALQLGSNGPSDLRHQSWASSLKRLAKPKRQISSKLETAECKSWRKYAKETLRVRKNSTLAFRLFKNQINGLQCPSPIRIQGRLPTKNPSKGYIKSW